jgi:polyisoprenoid-binding protein YceI
LKDSAAKFRAVFRRAAFVPAVVFALIAFVPGLSRAAMMRFKVDVDRSTVSAEVAEPAAWIRGNATGTFRIIDGAVSGDPDNIAGTARVRILLDATSYRSDNTSRDRAVTEKSLEADKYPTIGFESNSVVGVVMANSTEGTAIVNGFLNLHGEAHAMTTSVHFALKGDGTFAGDGEFKISYEDYGVKVPGVLFHSILAGNEATIRFHVVGVNAAAPTPTP